MVTPPIFAVVLCFPNDGSVETEEGLPLSAREYSRREKKAFAIATLHRETREKLSLEVQREKEREQRLSQTLCNT
ncbi:hypothetical protein VNO80_24424 [Phaseolus coccineus]|uniref:Uncharacterized protein n=1 Tax=Phaseolus coccineus TaxID=3886 RepID=A0AAN9QSC1_PHACN